MIDVILQKITAWFSNRAASRNHQEDSVWTPILKHIHQHQNPKPRCRSVAQQLMHEQPTVINAAFAAKYGEGMDMNPIERVNKRNEIARQLTATTYANMAPELERRAKETQERELKEWGLGLDGIEEAEDVHL